MDRVYVGTPDGWHDISDHITNVTLHAHGQDTDLPDSWTPKISRGNTQTIHSETAYRVSWPLTRETTDALRALLTHLQHAATAYTDAAWMHEHPDATVPPSRIHHTWKKT